MREDFERSMAINRKLFGRHAFRKSLSEANDNAYRSILNIALFEVCSVLLSRVKAADHDKLGDKLKTAVIGLFTNKNFVDDISFSTNSTRQVHGRFRIAEAALGEFLS